MENTIPSSNASASIMTPIKKVTAPLAMEQIKEFFEDKNVHFLIDYKNSQLKGELLLTYISNLDLPCDIDFSDCVQEDILSLMKDYFLTKSMIQSDLLKVLAAQIILISKNLNPDFLMEKPLLTAQSCQNFITTNIEMVERWNSVLSSSIYGCIASLSDIERQYNLKSAMPQNTDASYVGYNVMNLFTVAGFTETYFSVPVTHSIQYFKPLFEDCLFKGQNFLGYFNNNNNLLGMILEDTFLGHTSVDTLFNTSLGIVPENFVAKNQPLT